MIFVCTHHLKDMSNKDKPAALDPNFCRTQISVTVLRQWLQGFSVTLHNVILSDHNMHAHNWLLIINSIKIKDSISNGILWTVPEQCLHVLEDCLVKTSFGLQRNLSWSTKNPYFHQSLPCWELFLKVDRSSTVYSFPSCASTLILNMYALHVGVHNWW